MNSTRTKLIVVAALTLLPVAVYGQSVDPSVPAYDPSVNPRVQDPDHPDSALLPGGTAAWTGQPIMVQTPTSSPSGQSGSNRGNPFPSLSGTSFWSPGASSASSTATGSSSSSQSSNVVQGRNQTLNASRWTKLTGSRKRAMILEGVELEPAKSNRSADEFSAQQNDSSDPKAKLRMLKRAAQKTSRVRIVNPFQNKADTATSGRWHAGLASASALEEHRHEEASLMLHGYNAQSENRRRLRHRGVTPTPGSH